MVLPRMDADMDSEKALNMNWLDKNQLLGTDVIAWLSLRYPYWLPVAKRSTHLKANVLST